MVFRVLSVLGGLGFSGFGGSRDYQAREPYFVTQNPSTRPVSKNKF